MPQPSNTDDADAVEVQGRDAREGDTVGAVLADEERSPGGGGLMGADAGGADAGTAGAATPNSPIDAELPHSGGDGLAEREARARALGDEGGR